MGTENYFIDAMFDGFEPTTQPWIVCAANRYGNVIITGARHHDSIMRQTTALIGGGLDEDAWKRGWDILLAGIPEGGREEQGFIDQWGRYYNREEAELVARQNDQITQNQEGGRLSDYALHSEDLY